MTHRQTSFLLVVAVFLASLGIAGAAIDRTPTTTVGAAYYSSPSTLVNGDYDSLHTDNAHNLFVNVRAGSLPPGPGTTNPTPINITSSNGATAVTAVSATAAQVIVVWSLTLVNTDTVTHRVNVLTSSGTVIDTYIMPPGSTVFVDGAAKGFAVRTLSGEGLQFVLPDFGTEGGTGTTVKLLGYQTKQ